MKEDLKCSEEMVQFMLKSYKFEPEPYRKFGHYFIGHNHNLYRNKEKEERITRIEARGRFYKDVAEVENYHLIKKLRCSLPFYLFDILVHLAFDYGTSFVKNSKIYYHIENQNLEEIKKELESLKVFRGKVDQNNSKRRSFDIKLIDHGRYSEIKKDGNKEQSPTRYVGFRY